MKLGNYQTLYLTTESTYIIHHRILRWSWYHFITHRRTPESNSHALLNNMQREAPWIYEGEGRGKVVLRRECACESWSTSETTRAWYSRACCSASASRSPSCTQRRSSASSATVRRSNAARSWRLTWSSLSLLRFSSSSSSSFRFCSSLSNDIVSTPALEFLTLLPLRLWFRLVFNYTNGRVMIRCVQVHWTFPYKNLRYNVTHLPTSPKVNLVLSSPSVY